MSLRNWLHQHKDSIEAMATLHGARRIRLFGSVALGQETNESDIDFLVDFPSGYNFFTQRLALVDCLVALTGRRIDLLPEHELNHHIKASILESAVEL
jgi:uncharacterized protein